MNTRKADTAINQFDFNYTSTFIPKPKLRQIRDDFIHVISRHDYPVLENFPVFFSLQIIKLISPNLHLFDKADSRKSRLLHDRLLITVPLHSPLIERTVKSHD